MNDCINLTEFKTGIEIEKEINRIMLLAINYKISHMEANKEVEELIQYGRKIKEFSKEDYDSYMDRKNTKWNGEERTHIEFAINLKNGQKNEHKVLEYFVEYLKKRELKGRNREVRWKWYGSDRVGYIMIYNFWKRNDNPTKPDYIIWRDEHSIFVETKFFNSKYYPRFKVVNLNSYLKEEAFLAIGYKSKHYLFKKFGIEEILKNKKEWRWKQWTVVVSDKQLIDLLDKKIIKEI